MAKYFSAEISSLSVSQSVSQIEVVTVCWVVAVVDEYRWVIVIIEEKEQVDSGSRSRSRSSCCLNSTQPPGPHSPSLLKG